MRRTPAASSPATVNDLPGIPAMKLNGFAIAAHTAFTEARRSRVPGVGDDERARPLMERAERIAFVELSDGHNELFRSVVQGLRPSSGLAARPRTRFFIARPASMMPLSSRGGMAIRSRK